MKLSKRMINKVFVKQIGKNVKVYIDDMVFKSEKANKHVQVLEEVFDILRKFRVKLNLEKCVFGVAIGKFLGIMVS